MAGNVTFEMIDVASRRIRDALAQTAPGSVLPEDQQDKLLAQASAEACNVLTQWLDSFQWAALTSAAGALIGDAIPQWARVKPFLDPVRETLTRIAARQQNGSEVPDAAAYVDNALAAAERTARRYRRRKNTELFTLAANRIDSLRAEVCRLATEWTANPPSGERRAEWHKRTRWVLRKVPGLLLTLSVAMASASPAEMAHNIPAWGHDAVQVLFVHNIAAAAQPGDPIVLPRLGPHVH